MVRSIENRGRPADPCVLRTRLLSTSEPSTSTTSTLAELRHPAGRLLDVGEASVGEDREQAEAVALLGLEQVVAPVDGIAQRLLPFGQVAGTAAEHVEAALEAVLQVVDVEQLDPGGGQLDGQREPVEEPADGGDRLHVAGVAPEVRLHGLGPIAEQPHRLRVGGGRQVARLRERERWHGEDVLGPDPEGRPARDEHLEVPDSARAAPRCPTAAAITCSKLSSTRSTWRSRSASASASSVSTSPVTGDAHGARHRRVHAPPAPARR